MKFYSSICKIFISLLLILFSLNCNAQRIHRTYINGAFVTGFTTRPNYLKADKGFEIRFGNLSPKRIDSKIPEWLRVYGGLQFYHTFPGNNEEYTDNGLLFIAGLDFRILNKEKIKVHIETGPAVEALFVVYPSSTNVTGSVLPDIGLLVRYKKINFLFGHNPSLPNHFKFGIGYTLEKVRNTGSP